jgi:sugar-specific transcriptional regulator TrmB
MFIPNEETATLTELGLSNTQALIFLCLAKSGTLTAKEISKTTYVARPHVYTILSELEETGLVIRIIDQPEQFEAVNIADGVSALMQRRINKTAELQEKVGKLMHTFKISQPESGHIESPQFSLIPKKDAVYAKSAKMLGNLKNSVDFLCLTRRMVSWLSMCQPLVESALARGVDCRVIMPRLSGGTEIWNPIKALMDTSHFFLRLIPEEPKFGFSIWDKREVLLTTSAADSPNPANTLWTNNSALISLCQEHYECIWSKAHSMHPLSIEVVSPTKPFN